MYRISKEFSFCYGHRVWTQKLDHPDLSVDQACVCRHLHGHEAKVRVYLEALELTDSMVTDFKNLTWLKQWLDIFVDHKFIIDLNDPLFNHLTRDAKDLIPITVGFRNDIVGFTLDPRTWEHETPISELLGGFLVVQFVPTSENLAKWIHRIVEAKMGHLGINVPRVDWWETPKSMSTYLKP